MSKTESSAGKIPRRASRMAPSSPVGEGTSSEGINSFLQIMLWMKEGETPKSKGVEIKWSYFSIQEKLDALRVRHQALENAITKENISFDPYASGFAALDKPHSHNELSLHDSLFSIAGNLFLAGAVKHGFPVKAIHLLIKRNVLTKNEVASYIMPRRTLAHRERKGEPLSESESERLLRITRIVAIAEDTFANSEKAAIWLRRPNRLMNGRTPLGMADTEPGSRIVEDTLQRIAYGIAA